MCSLLVQPALRRRFLANQRFLVLSASGKVRLLVAALKSLISFVVLDAPSSSTDPAETANSTNALASEANADHVAQLMAMGFTQPQAVEALTVSNGDVDRAAAYLLNAS
jgi:uncharacterized UBP type Zn finger protein